MELVVGCDLDDFRSYYEKAIRTTEYRRAVGENDGVVEMRYVMEDPTHLILWKEGDGILGHAIWHESNTDEHRKGVPRDDDDRRILRELLGGKQSFIELHELWLAKEHRGKGYGKQFFEFFEKFVSSRGYDMIVHHAFDQSVLAICRRRRYKEAYGVMVMGKPSWVFCLSLKRA